VKLELAEVRSAMREMDVSWEASETEVTPYLEVEGTELFGLNIKESERLSMMAAARDEPNRLLALAPPPSEIDWRDHNGQNWVTDVRNQRTCGACVAFATCAVLESRSRKTVRNSKLDIDLSEAHLFFCGAGRACTTGWHFDPALEFCRDSGVGRENQFPYQPSDQPCQGISAIVEVSSWSREVSEIARKQAIAQGGPVIAGMKVYEDLYYYRKGVYRQVAGAFRGYHAVAVIGYSDPGQYLIVKNSWGKRWGDGGFMYISFGECGLDTQFPFYNPTVLYRGK
jgi:C1A family cysteine protease